MRNIFFKLFFFIKFYVILRNSCNYNSVFKIDRYRFSLITPVFIIIDFLSVLKMCFVVFVVFVVFADLVFFLGGLGGR